MEHSNTLVISLISSAKRWHFFFLLLGDDTSEKSLLYFWLVSTALLRSGGVAGSRGSRQKQLWKTSFGCRGAESFMNETRRLLPAAVCSRRIDIIKKHRRLFVHSILLSFGAHVTQTHTRACAHRHTRTHAHMHSNNRTVPCSFFSPCGCLSQQEDKPCLRKAVGSRMRECYEGAGGEEKKKRTDAPSAHRWQRWMWMLRLSTQPKRLLETRVETGLSAGGVAASRTHSHILWQREKFLLFFFAKEPHNGHFWWSTYDKKGAAQDQCCLQIRMTLFQSPECSEKYTHFENSVKISNNSQYLF